MKKIGKNIDPSRFRANLLIDNIDPWKEFNWVGKTIEIGDCILEVLKEHKDVQQLMLIQKMP